MSALSGGATRFGKIRLVRLSDNDLSMSGRTGRPTPSLRCMICRQIAARAAAVNFALGIDERAAILKGMVVFLNQLPSDRVSLSLSNSDAYFI